MRERIANILKWLGAIALFLAVMPFFQYTGGVTADQQMMEYLLAHPDSMPYREEFRFGWAESPLLQHISERGLEVSPEGEFSVYKTSNLTIGWFSWSSFTLALAVVLFCAMRVLRRVNGTPISEPR